MLSRLVLQSLYCQGKTNKFEDHKLTEPKPKNIALFVSTMVRIFRVVLTDPDALSSLGDR